MMKQGEQQALSADANSTATADWRKPREIAELALEVAESEEKDKKAMRFRRGMVFWFLLFPSAFIPVALLVLLGFSAYGCLPFPCEEAKGDSTWPMVAFVSGTFLSFIAVFGFLAVGVFSSRDKPPEFPISGLIESLNRGSEGS